MSPSEYLAFLADLLAPPPAKDKNQQREAALTLSVAKAFQRVRSPGLLRMLVPALQALLLQGSSTSNYAALLLISVLDKGGEEPLILPEEIIEPMVAVLGDDKDDEDEKDKHQLNTQSSSRRLRYDVVRVHQDQILSPLVKHLSRKIMEGNRTKDERQKILVYMRQLFQRLDLCWSLTRESLLSLQEWCRKSGMAGSDDVVRDIGLMSGIK